MVGGPLLTRLMRLRLLILAQGLFAGVDRLCLALLVCLISTAAAAGTTNRPAADPAPSFTRHANTNSPWERLVLIGASVTAGFTESEPFGGPKTRPLRLNRYVDAALAVPHEPARNLASAFVFLQPESASRKQIDDALKAQPTLVLGLDFLFWFCYGDGNTDAERLQRFDQGLKLLESFKCPLVLGDLPDASAAVNRQLRPDQIPTPRALAAANHRLREWAAGRRQVAILPLSSFMRTTLRNQSLRVHRHVLPAGKTLALLQEDRLHPSATGAAFLAVSLLDAFQATRRGSPDGEVRWDPDEVFRLGSAAAAHAAGN